ncbi:hypothetical protein Q3G72_007907 [Acer saccharum]|nr:hypothetical protein Q3G72_007907 [Acer saccharum]
MGHVRSTYSKSNDAYSMPVITPVLIVVIRYRDPKAKSDIVSGFNPFFRGWSKLFNGSDDFNGSDGYDDFSNPFGMFDFGVISDDYDDYGLSDHNFDHHFYYEYDFSDEDF